MYDGYYIVQDKEISSKCMHERIIYCEMRAIVPRRTKWGNVDHETMCVHVNAIVANGEGSCPTKVW